MYEEGKENPSKSDTKEDDSLDGDRSTLLPEIDFSTFIFSLNSSALVQLGVLSNPISGEKSSNLALAKHTIDTISMLKNKTEGNLTSEEYSIISNILYDLKILYVSRHGT